MTTASDAEISVLVELLNACENGVAFTGAGISTESGIADFRSPGGVWSRHQPVMYQDFLDDEEERRRYWMIRKETMPGIIAAQPNAGHLALARLEALGKLKAIITQNIDELHQRAGCRRVLEVHGSAMRVGCLSCGWEVSAEEIQNRMEAGLELPTCDECGGIAKSRTVSFGETLPGDVWMEAMEFSRRCDLFLAVGSSLVVYPAAGLPEVALRYGAALVILNRDPTPLDEHATLVIRAPIGETMRAAMARLGH